MRQIKVLFKGYYWCKNTFPETSGVYAIYSTNDNKVSKLCYIGRSNNIDRRIKEHANSDYPAKDKYCYSYCELSEYQAKLSEAALVNECQPIGNDQYKDEYPEDYESVELIIEGEHYQIPNTIRR